LDAYREVVSMNSNQLPIYSHIRSSASEYVYVHPHWHNIIEILYIKKGSGIQHINNSIFPFEAGDIIVIGYNDIHATYTNKYEENEILIIRLSLNLLESRSDNLSINNLIYSINDYVIDNPIKASTKIGGIIKDSLFNIHNELESKMSSYELILRSETNKILGLINRFYSLEIKKKKGLYKTDKIKSVLKNTFALIDEKYTQKLTLSEAAKASSLSISHFLRLFSESTGMPFIRYLNFYRVNKSIDLMETNLSLTNISLECGFGSLSSFIRSFKQYKDTTPSTYRKKYYT
jgi:AraC-like DNA-binding protein